MIQYLTVQKERKDGGWLRLAEAKVADRPTPNLLSHLSPLEKQLVFQLRNCLRGTGRKSKSPTTLVVAHAWGVTGRTIQNIDKLAFDTPGEMDLKRKQRSDAGQTVFNSVKKQKAVFNPVSVFKKSKRRESRGECVTEKELADMLKTASPNCM